MGNLCFDAEVEHLQQLFSEYGAERKCILPLAHKNGPQARLSPSGCRVDGLDEPGDREHLRRSAQRLGLQWVVGLVTLV